MNTIDYLYLFINVYKPTLDPCHCTTVFVYKPMMQRATDVTVLSPEAFELHLLTECLGRGQQTDAAWRSMGKSGSFQPSDGNSFTSAAGSFPSHWLVEGLSIGNVTEI